MFRVGVVGDQAEGRLGGRTARFADLQALVRCTEDAGLDSFWLADHFLFNPPDETDVGGWEAFTFLSALAATTSRVLLGPMVACVSFRRPTLLARMAESLDEISGGRFILALGAGWNAREYEMFGYRFDHRVDRLEEALQIIVPLIREGHVDFEGRYYRAHDAFSRPRGPSGPLLPIWIAAWQPRMLRLAARYADAWNTNGHAVAASVSAAYPTFVQACRQVGRDPGTVELTAGTDVHLLDRGEQRPTDERGIVGRPEEVAEALSGFAHAGVRHLICSVRPYSPAGIERLGTAVELLRSSISDEAGPMLY